ncbi:MAG: glycyl-radical enzyme activating protein [Candidatus Saccharicenans sp.]|jgi:pyruvate formate lyase activating enzyme|nr:glycyl-radical enzyme activating protein [Candidatus Saccharicenans sp.]MDH7492800.1 glycyl-radical enzyme activating protein [Candidatus Saccharicenans sp.]
MKALIFDLKRYAVHDGPGIRLNVFFKGCPLHCLWCHNPEGVAFEPELMLMPNRCARCGDCVRACRYGALNQDSEGQVEADRSRCTLCGDCLEACQREAIAIVGREMTVEEIAAEAEKERVFFEQSGGGVTLTGGEPLAQPALAEALMDGLRRRGIQVALDTSGYAPREIFLRLAEKADLILFDLKLMDEKKHQKYTGVSNRPILENLKALETVGRPVWVRFPLIPGVNADDQNLEAMAEFLSGLKMVQQLSVLPYHKGGVEKFRRLGRQAEFAVFEPPSPEQVEKVIGFFRKKGFQVKRGG